MFVFVINAIRLRREKLDDSERSVSTHRKEKKTSEFLIERSQRTHSDHLSVQTKMTKNVPKSP